MTAVHRMAAVATRCTSGPTISLLGRRLTPCILHARTGSRPLLLRRMHAGIQPTKDIPDTPMDPQSEQDNEKLASSEPPADPPFEDTVPWFLRVEAPKVSHHPFAERQALPELPENPPAELAELLNQLSIELGVTDIKLMDLRELDPPPAIGANTVMIFGSARSIRHLHATADKACRWLRSTYKWTPYADGILGRNELKLIARRKRRRGKVVSSQMGELEDAESAGWVCIQSGKGLVVQLFVESKRKEMDLEGLWQESLNRLERRKEREIERQAKAAAVAAGGREYVKPGPSKEEIAAALQKPVLWKPPVNDPVTQRRSLHTVSWRMNMDPGFYTARSLDDSVAGSVPDSVESPMKLVFSKLVFPEVPGVVDGEQIPKAEAELKVKALLQDLTKNEWGADLLGGGFQDTASTEFLRTFFSHMKGLKQFDQMTYYLQFLAAANQIKPRAYPFSVIKRFLAGKDCDASPLDIGNPWHFSHYYAIIAHNTNSRPFTTIGIDKGKLRRDGKMRTSLPAWRLKRIRSIMGGMNQRYTKEEMNKFMQSPEMRYTMSSIVCFSHTVPIRKAVMAGDLGAARRLFPRLPRPLHEEYYMYRPQPPKVDGYAIRNHHLDELTALCTALNWNDFWKTWTKLQISRFRRDGEYYTLVAGLVATSENVLAALKTARELPDEAAREDPPVELKGLLAQYLYDVVSIAENQSVAGSIRDVPLFQRLKRQLKQELEKPQSELIPESANMVRSGEPKQDLVEQLQIRKQGSNGTGSAVGRTGLQLDDNLSSSL